MAAFNYKIKSQTYALVLEKMRESLRGGRLSEGTEWLARALELCGQLEKYSSVVQLKERYAAERRSLAELQISLRQGKNPFLEQINCAQNSPAKREENPSPLFSFAVPAVKLKDVAGLEEVKRQIRLRVIAPVQNPDLYYRYMDEVGCRILLYGPPGCGKSFVAEAIAGELGCAYVVLGAAELLEKYVGEGPKKLASLFQEAERYENCLLFFDELDAVFSARENEDSRYTKDVLTTFLSCLSGFRSHEQKGVRVIIGATNRPWALDPALVRGKRFDTHIYVGLPDAAARAHLIRVAFSKNPLLLQGSDLTEEMLVRRLDGYSCADIAAVCEKMKARALERALEKAEHGKGEVEPVTQADADSVLQVYRNSVTQESLQAFRAFSEGVI